MTIRSERLFWVLGILFGAAGVFVGIKLLLDDTWSQHLFNRGYRSRSFAAGLAVIMAAIALISIRNLIRTFREPKYPDRPY